VNRQAGKRESMRSQTGRGEAYIQAKTGKEGKHTQATWQKREANIGKRERICRQVGKWRSMHRPTGKRGNTRRQNRAFYIRFKDVHS
jgi:hypothetical protein